MKRKTRKVDPQVCSVVGLSADEQATAMGRTIMKAAFERAGISRTELAKRMEVTPGRVTQILDYDRNWELKTIVRLLFACGQVVDFCWREPEVKGKKVMG